MVFAAGVEVLSTAKLVILVNGRAKQVIIESLRIPGDGFVNLAECREAGKDARVDSCEGRDNT